MNAVAIVSIVLGLTIIITRGPLVFAPQKTKNFYLQFFETHQRVRGVGLLMAVVGVVILLALAESTGLLAQILIVFGWILVVGAVAFIAPFPGAAKTVIDRGFGMVNETVLRVIGALAVAVGVVLVYAGATA